MKQNLILLASAILFLLTNGKILTPAAKRHADTKRREWNLKAAAIQKELDEQHAKGRARRYYDGKEINFVPFTR